MIGPGAGARVMVATRPVDFRKGPDALAALVGAEYGGDPYSGVIYVFRAKRADRIKLVRSEEHTSELQSLMRISYAVFCLKKKKKQIIEHKHSSSSHKTRTEQR